MTRAQLAQHYRQVARNLAAGANVIQLHLGWGNVQWRASTEQIEGRDRYGQPFTIQNASRDGLIQWLNGTSLLTALPHLDDRERQLLTIGKEPHTR